MNSIMNQIRRMLDNVYDKIFSPSGEKDDNTATEYYYKIQYLRKLAGRDQSTGRDWVAFFKEADDHLQGVESTLAASEKKIKEGKISTSHLPEDSPDRQFWTSKEEKLIKAKSNVQKYKKSLNLAREIFLGPGK